MCSSALATLVSIPTDLFTGAAAAEISGLLSELTSLRDDVIDAFSAASAPSSHGGAAARRKAGGSEALLERLGVDTKAWWETLSAAESDLTPFVEEAIGAAAAQACHAFPPEREQREAKVGAQKQIARLQRNVWNALDYHLSFSHQAQLFFNSSNAPIDPSSGGHDFTRRLSPVQDRAPRCLAAGTATPT